jgi:glycerol-3-phosphate dehydrogenase
MTSAISLGAELKMPAEFTTAVFEYGHWTVRYAEKDGTTREARTSFLINAAGPWANMVLDKIVPKQGKVSVELVQGSHVIVDGTLENGIYYVEAPADHRGVFLIPWYGQIMIGTTETVFNGDPSKVAPLDKEIDYLFQTAGRYFPRLNNLSKADIKGSFAGLRVLPAGDKNAFHRSRETLLHGENLENTRLLSIFGGKLTSYRATGEAVINKIAPYLPDVERKADTKTLILK